METQLVGFRAILWTNGESFLIIISLLDYYHWNMIKSLQKSFEFPTSSAYLFLLSLNNKKYVLFYSILIYANIK